MVDSGGKERSGSEVDLMRKEASWGRPWPFVYMIE